MATVGVLRASWERDPLDALRSSCESDLLSGSTDSYLTASGGWAPPEDFGVEMGQGPTCCPELTKPELQDWVNKTCENERCRIDELVNADPEKWWPWKNELDEKCRDIPRAERSTIHPFPDIIGFKFSQPTPPIAGNWVKLGDREWVAHQMPTTIRRRDVERTDLKVFETMKALKSSLIICLSSTEETPRNWFKQIDHYWNTEEVKLIKEEVLMKSETGQELIERKFSFNGHEITQLHLDKWKDEESDPDPNLLLCLLEKVDEFKDTIPFIHCSGGIHRTREYICAEELHNQLKKDINAKVNIPQLFLTTLLYRPYSQMKALRALFQMAIKMRDLMQLRLS